jgi:hypothetical protein
MTTTQISERPKVNHVVAIVTRDGQRLGHVILRANGTYKASRKHGDSQDMRRLSNGFRTLDNAIAFVERAGM